MFLHVNSMKRFAVLRHKLYCIFLHYIMFKGVSPLYIQRDLVKIKSDLADNVGHKVRLKAKHGRKQIIVRDGVIENTYPSIFTVKLDVQNDIPTSERRVSYSYADVLTKAVELIICEPEDASDIKKAE